MIPTLLGYASNTASSRGLRHATLEALGYVCEELGAFEEDYLQQDQVNAILTAVVASMRPDESDMELRLAATTALNNALEFAHSNFENEGERNYLMQMICYGTQASDERVRQSSWECLVRIASFYYVHLPTYMGDIFALTQKAVREDEEAVGLQALEFWSTVAEEEDMRSEDGSTEVNHQFVKAALPQLTALLLEQLTKQEEGSESEDGAWNIALAAGTALGLVAAVVKDPIVELVMPFVQENIQRSANPNDWRLREAATFAFGSILEGPRVETLTQIARAGLSFLLVALRDAHPQVRNTTAWTLGRIFEFVAGEELEPPPLLGPQNLPQVVASLLEAIRDEPHIAEKVCYALSQLAGVFRGVDPSPLSPYFKDVVGALLDTASRHQQVDSAATTTAANSLPSSVTVRLQMQAFEAVNEVVRCSSIDASPLVAQLVPIAVSKLAETTSRGPAHTSPETAEKQAELQGLLCGVIQVVMQKLTDGNESTKKSAGDQADTVMQALLHVLTWRQDVTINEEAMLAVGALTYTCGRDFAKYMDAFFPILERGLVAAAEWQTCLVCVQVLGDVCRALEEQIYSYCDRIMLILLQNLQDETVHRAVKPQILSACGDIALAIGDRFEAYLPHVLTMLQGASNLCVQLVAAASSNQGSNPDEDRVDYINTLRQGVLDAWTGIINGMSKAQVDKHVRQSTLGIIDFIESIAQDEAGADAAVCKSAAALLGDVASSISGVGGVFAQKPIALQFLQRCSEDQGIQETAQWAARMVQAAMAAR